MTVQDLIKILSEFPDDMEVEYNKAFRPEDWDEVEFTRNEILVYELSHRIVLG